MAETINQIDVLTALNNLMGRRELPGGIQDDLKRYCQYAFDYSWRYYRWTFSMKIAPVVPAGDGNSYMPDDFDLDGYRKVIGSATEITLEQYASSTSTTGQFALQWNATLEKYQVLGETNFSVYYQVVPPTLGDGSTPALRAPFPSAMTVAIGAAIYAKQAENPTRADIKQEWEEFHQELDRHVGRSERNIPHARAQTAYSRSGVNVGDS